MSDRQANLFDELLVWLRQRSEHAKATNEPTVAITPQQIDAWLEIVKGEALDAGEE